MANQVNIQQAAASGCVAFVAPGDARVRLEIDEFLEDNALTNLFLLALIDMFKENSKLRAKTEDWWTFYSLSGIHGQPVELWDNVAQKTSDTPANGYCTHGMLFFPTWHRAYVGMFEQAVANKVNTIAGLFTNEPEKTLYKAAADRFRMPYWDPVMPRNKPSASAVGSKKVDESIWGLPKILGAERVYVIKPGSQQPVEVDNPLYSFTFPSEATLKDKGRQPIKWQDHKNWHISTLGQSETVRSPGADGKSNIWGNSKSENRQGLNLKIQRQAVQTSTKLWKLLSPYNKEHNNHQRPWAGFATHFVVDDEGNQILEEGEPIYQDDTSVSLESWHDDIHTLVGTGYPYNGHMALPPTAGFDPIFWMHHCNVDRILALYQALYADKWFPNSGAQKSSTELYPFRRTNGQTSEFYNSDDLRDWKKLGFAIPGSQDITEEGVAALETYLFEYYNWSTEGIQPPASVSEKWPKTLESSIALHGPKAKPDGKPGLSIAALVDNKLVTRVIGAPTATTLGNAAGKQAPIALNLASTATGGAHHQNTVEDHAHPVKAPLKPVELPQLYPPVSIINGPGGGQTRQPTWNARIRVEKFAFNGSFSVHLFIGDIKDDQTERFLTKKNEIGFTGIFASPWDAPCANCEKQRAEGAMYQDAIPITHALYDFLRTNAGQWEDGDGPDQELRVLDSFRPEHVVPFLKEHLQWRVVDAASGLIEDEQALRGSKLEVVIFRRDYELPSENRLLGVYFPATGYPEITRGKVGGAGPV